MSFVRGEVYQARSQKHRESEIEHEVLYHIKSDNTNISKIQAFRSILKGKIQPFRPIRGTVTFSLWQPPDKQMILLDWRKRVSVMKTVDSVSQAIVVLAPIELRRTQTKVIRSSLDDKNSVKAFLRSPLAYS